MVAIAAILAFIPAPARSQVDPQKRWYKGNTHTHTLNSDGDSTPDEVVRWYREHGYHFLVLTDHNFLTETASLNALMGADGQFLIVRGEEVSARFERKPIHVNGLNLDQLVEPQTGATVVETVQRNVDAVRAARGVPHVNHPNFEWAITAEELAQVRNYRLLEIFNGHPLVNNQGGGGHPGLETVWDLLLTGGQVVYGIAVDDAHDFKRPWDRGAAKPGQGWVMVRSEKLAAKDLFDAIERGDFYASTGVELQDYTVDNRRITIELKPKGTTKYRVLFIGSGGRVLKEVVESPATYEFAGGEGYVRAKVIDSNGYVAWTQPVFPPAAR